MAKKEETEMQTEAVTETITDRSAVLSLAQVKEYADRMVARKHAEYYKGTIQVRNKHPMDQCLKRGIIEEWHAEIAKRIRNYRDCAVSKLSGRTYNATGDGDGDMDAATVYAHLLREMITSATRRRQWELVKIVCFMEPNIDGDYLTETEYGFLLGIAPNIQYALEAADEVIRKAREEIQDRLK